MKIKLFPLLSLKSKKVFFKTHERLSQRVYVYNPRYDLLKRLSRKTGMSTEECREQLIKEREYLIKFTDIIKRQFDYGN